MTRSASAPAAPPSSSAASAAAALRRLCSPGTASSSSSGSSSSARTTCGTSPSQSSKSRSTSPRDVKVVWWSRSTFRRTAISGRSAATERSDSSPSTTSHPAPACALPPSCGISPPIRYAGSSPSRSRQNAIIPLVVVLPCAPATTIDRRSETSSASKSARGRPSTRPAYAVDTYDSQPAGGEGGSGESVTAIAGSRCARYGVSWRSQPATSAPHACASSAYALMPAPPIPAIQRRLPASGCELDELIGDPLCCVGLRGAAHRLAHRAQPRLVAEQLLDERGNTSDIGVVDDGRAAGVDEVLRVRALMVGGRMRIRDEHRWLACCRHFPDRAARPGNDEVGGAERRTEVVDKRQEDVVVAAHARAQCVVRRLTAQVQHARAGLAPRSECSVVDRRGTL